MARAAFAEVRLKARLAPAVTETDAAVDLVVTLAGRRLRDRAYALRLRYQPRSPAAARHSSIPATARATAGVRHLATRQAIRGITRRTRRRASACQASTATTLRWTQANERPDGTTLLGFLLELPGVIDE